MFDEAVAHKGVVCVGDGRVWAVVTLVVGFWVGYKAGYSSAVRRSGVNSVKSGLRRMRTGRW